MWRSNPPQPQTIPQAPQARNHPFPPATHLLRRRLRITEKETHVVFASAVVVLLKILSLCVDTRPSTLKIETGVLVARTVCAFVENHRGRCPPSSRCFLARARNRLRLGNGAFRREDDSHTTPLPREEWRAFRRLSTARHQIKMNGHRSRREGKAVVHRPRRGRRRRRRGGGGGGREKRGEETEGGWEASAGGVSPQVTGGGC